jgi:hypothetical protein
MGDTSSSAVITFPVRCRYLGGHRALGGRGRHLWIRGGRLGHGIFRLTHSIPLSEVLSVEVSERQVAGTGRKLVYAAGVRTRGGGAFRHPPAQFTDLVVRTKDGLEAAWEVNRRGENWVRDKLRLPLHGAGVPFYDELLPDQRTRRPGGG